MLLGSSSYGVSATEHLYKGELLFSAPLSTCFRGLNTPELSPMFEDHPELFSESTKFSDDYRIITSMLFENSKGPSGQWFYYFQSLPANPETSTLR